MADAVKTPNSPAVAPDLGATFSALQRSLRHYLRHKIGDYAIADDLLQEVFIKALTSIQAGKIPANMTGWLYAVARTSVADYYRAAHMETIELNDDLPDTQHDDDEQLHQELAACLRPLAQQLPAIYRDALLATDFYGQTLKALATAQGVSYSAVKSRTSRARMMLKEKLLACCQVEVSGNTISDYQCHSSSPCSDG